MKQEKTLTVERAPTRCPFCHEDCRSVDANVVCHECLARHHAACWVEGSSCGSCGSTRALEGRGTSPGLTRAEAVRALAQLGYAPAEVERLFQPSAHWQQRRPELRALVAITAIGTLVAGVTADNLPGHIGDAIVIHMVVLAGLLLPFVGACSGAVTRRALPAVGASACVVLGTMLGLLSAGYVVAGLMLGTLLLCMIPGSLAGLIAARWAQRLDRRTEVPESEAPESRA